MNLSLNLWKRIIDPTMSTNGIKGFVILFLLMTILGLSSVFAIDEYNAKTITEENVQRNEIVKGTVKDESGNTLPGVAILEKGTTNGTITDFDGAFGLTLIREDAILVFSSIGMISEEIAYTGQSSIELIMKQDIIGLEEMIVIGYTTQRKADLTGAVAAINGKDLMVAPTPNITQNLAGKLTGVITQQYNGKPGDESMEFVIRGKGTPNNSAPLVLVDGIERSFSHIDPNDIESISILKDASSSAIYGVKGANGVILVTTKRAKEGTAQVTYTTNYSIQAPVWVPDMMNSAQYARGYNEARFNKHTLSGKDPDVFRPEFSESDIEFFESDEAINTDWWSQTMAKTAPMQQHNLTISQGTDKIRFLGSLGLLDQEGLYDLSSYKRFNVRSNIDANITENLTFGLDLAGRSEIRMQAPNEAELFRNFISSLPTEEPYKVVGGKTYYNWNGLNTTAIGKTEGSGYQSDKWNVIETSAYVNYNVPFIQGMSAKLLFSYDKSFLDEKDLDTPYEYYASDVLSVSRASIKLRQNAKQITKKTLQFTLNYEKTFGESKIGALFVYEQADRYDEFIEATYDGLLSSSLDQLFAGTVNPEVDGKATEIARLGYVGRIHYNYADKYMLQANVRYDKSFKFMPDNSAGIFPAFSAAWRVTEEDFLKGNDILSNLKVRASYGIFGNDQVPAYQYLALYSPGSLGIVTGSGQYQPGYESGVDPNFFATWETATNWNIGVDFGLLDGKISGEFDYFGQRTENILKTSDKEVPWSSGAKLAKQNIGVVNKKGIEAILRYKDKVGDFTYSVEGNVTHAKSVVTDYKEAEGIPEQLKLEGKALGQQFGYESLGLFKDAEDIANSPFQDFGDYQPGDIKYADISGPLGMPDDTVDVYDRTAIGGSSLPEIVFGLNFYMSYKNIEFTANFQGAANYYTHLFYDAFGLKANAMAVMEDSWRAGNENSRFPRTYIGQSYNNKQSSSYWMNKGKYIKLRNIELAYTVPKIDALQKAGLNSLRLSVSGNNLLSISNIKDFDPETQTNHGVHPLYYPQFKSFNFGARATF